MPQVTPAQFDAAARFTAWINNLDDAARADVHRVPAAETLDRWVAATGASNGDRETVLHLTALDVIALEDDGLWKNRAWSDEQ